MIRRLLWSLPLSLVVLGWMNAPVLAQDGSGDPQASPALEGEADERLVLEAEDEEPALEAGEPEVDEGLILDADEIEPLVEGEEPPTDTADDSGELEPDGMPPAIAPNSAAEEPDPAIAPAPAESLATDEAEVYPDEDPVVEEYDYDEGDDWGEAEGEDQGDGGELSPEPGAGFDPEQFLEAEPIFTEDTNPLNPLGDGSFEQLLRLRINDDSWTAMIDPLPCLDASQACVRQLQELAVESSFVLQEIDMRIELVEEQIDIARTNNQRTIRLGIFEPFIEELIRLETISRVPDPDNPQQAGTIIRTEQEGFLERIGRFFFQDTALGVNTLLSFIGVPLFRAGAGGDTAAQQRSIDIADLQVKVAEVQQQRGEMANQLRERVLESVLEFETTRREFQAYQEMGRRSQLRHEVVTLNYRFVPDSLSTPQYLAELNALDAQYLQMFRSWAQLRTQLTEIQILVLGSEEGF